MNFDVKFLFRCRYAGFDKKMIKLRCASKNFVIAKRVSRKNTEIWLRLCVCDRGDMPLLTNGTVLLYLCKFLVQLLDISSVERRILLCRVLH